MISLQDVSDSDFYEPYYDFYDYYPSYYIPHGSACLSDHDTGSCGPHCSRYLFRSHTISYEPCDHGTSTTSHDRDREPHGDVAKRGAGSHGQRDHSSLSGARCPKPRCSIHVTGSGIAYLDLYGSDSHSNSDSSHDPHEYDPIPVGRGGYVYRRRYSCRPILSDARWYGSKTYYPPSYWMKKHRYYGPY